MWSVTLAAFSVGESWARGEFIGAILAGREPSSIRLLWRPSDAAMRLFRIRLPWVALGVVTIKRHNTKLLGNSWVTSERSYLVTFGLVFIALTALIWKKQGDTFSEWPAWYYFVFLGFPIVGLALIAVGLFAGRARIEKWADDASLHEASIIIMIVAFPVFLLMKMFKRDEDEF